MNHDPKKQYAFKRLETDEEFRARLAKVGDDHSAGWEHTPGNKPSPPRVTKP